MRHKRYVRLAIVAFVVVMVLGVFAPAAFAGRVTRIMYAQESFDTYLVVPTSTQALLSVTLAWGTGSPVYPVAAVNAFVQTGPAPNKYESVEDATLYDPTINPVTNATKMVTVQNQEYWISIQPYVGDALPYTLTVELQKKNPTTPAGTWYGKDGTGTPSPKSGDGSCIWTATGTAYASDGEWYKDGSYGQYYGVGQYWPGTMAAPITNWNLYNQDRANYGGNWAEWTYPYSWESNTAKLYTGNGATSGSDMSTAYMDNLVGTATEVDIWYSQTPQQWSCATNVGDPWTGRGVPAPSPDFTYYPKPKSYTWTANAALWHTYSFVQTTRADKPGYMWGGVSTASASKRHFVSTKSYNQLVTWRYQGPAFNWVFNTGARGGICRVTVDGVERTPTGYPDADVDQYSASTVTGVSRSYNVGGTATAWHEVSIKGTGRTSSTTTPKGYYVYHDKFVDPDDITPAAEDNYDGMTGYAWDKTTTAGPSGGAFMSTPDFGASTAFTFQTNDATQANRKIKWQYVKGTRGGIQNVYIDGQFVGTVDQWATGTTLNQSTTWTDGATYAGKVLSMPQGTWHTIFITGSGQTSSVTVPKGFFIYSDMFQAEAQTVVEAE